MTRKNLAWIVVWGTILIGGLTACAGTASEAGGLPTLVPTMTALPPIVPTDVPLADPIALPPVNWDDLDRFRAAMRPAFAGDIDAFAHRNRYYIEARLVFEDEVAILRGAQRVRYTNRSADTLNEIVFRLYPNLPALAGRMVVYQTEVNGAPVEAVLAERDTALIVPLDTPLTPGASVEITMQFSVAAERGMYASYGAFGYQRQVFSGPEWYPVLSVYEEGRGWWMERATPSGDAVYSETGLYEVYFTVPDDFVLIMSGTEVETFPAGDGMTTHHIVSGPMRDLLVVASPIFGKTTSYVDDIAINVYYWPGDEVAAEQVLRIASDAVRIFNEQFGPYPFAELDVAETFNFTGIEYPGVIIIADRIWEPGDEFMEIATAHEVGHQWFYSVIGNNQVDHPWLDESLTSFTEYVYLRALYGEKRFKDTTQSDRDWYNYYKSTGAPDLPLNLPVSAYDDSNYSVIVYVKGPIFYLELEKLLGRERFMDALQLYYQRHRYEVVSSADVLRAFEDATGEDLDAFFYQWVGEFEGLDPAVIAEEQARTTVTQTQGAP